MDEDLDESIPYKTCEMHIVYGIGHDGTPLLANGFRNENGELIDYFTGMMMLACAQQQFIEAWHEENGTSS